MNGIEGGVIFGFKDGDASKNVPLPKLSIDGVGFNGYSVGESVELPIRLVRPNIDLGQMRNGNGKVILLHLKSNLDPNNRSSIGPPRRAPHK